MTITTSEILNAVRGAKPNIVQAIVDYLPYLASNHDIDTPLRLQHFLAQAAHETDGFKTTEEYASGKAYEGRQDLGNTQPGDGVRFKGRGIFMFTGRANYTSYGKRIFKDLVNNPALAADPEVSVELAALYWDDKGLNKFADQDDIKTITKRINGGFNGLQDRVRYLTIFKTLIK